MMRRTFGAALMALMACTACIAGVSLAACRGGAGVPGAAAEQDALGTYSDPPATAVPESQETKQLEPGALATVVSEPVMNWYGPGGRPFEVTLRTPDAIAANARRFGTTTLSTSLRTRAPNVGQYPCTSCHLGRRIVLRDERIGDVHQSVQPEHPAQTGATCATCHAAENVEMLALKSGERATLDHAYRLCAQCHFLQVESWAAGAHGKRLDGWQGRRVMTGCADCHDPHRPALEPRIPFRAPQLKRTGGGK